MMVLLNHAISAAISPVGFWFFAMIAMGVCVWRGWRRTAWGLGIGASVLLWAAACGWGYRLIGGSLERQYPPVPVAEVPQADAIVLLGGGVEAAPEKLPYPEMLNAADRVWHAARLWKGGKAPFIAISGAGDLYATKPLLLDFGVDEKAIRVDNESRNTEENAKCVARLLAGKKENGAKARILLVTSAWHMRRAKLMFERYAPDLEIIAAPCDHEALNLMAYPLEARDFFPNADALYHNSFVIKEIIGYYGYKWLRR